MLLLLLVRIQVNLLSLLEGAAEGLAHLHMHHIVHGDLNVRCTAISAILSAAAL